MESDFYQPGHRQLQDRFDTRRLADRLTEITVSDTFSDHHRSLIEAAPFLWLATADADGWPDVSYKGGVRGFCRVLDDTTLWASPATTATACTGRWATSQRTRGSGCSSSISNGRAGSG
jgi:predicted pyridoxine 5'-phosphate oxidase superfamily flavin-nucleotide-binding protein